MASRRLHSRGNVRKLWRQRVAGAGSDGIPLYVSVFSLPLFQIGALPVISVDPYHCR